MKPMKLKKKISTLRQLTPQLRRSKIKWESAKIFSLLLDQEMHSIFKLETQDQAQTVGLLDSYMFYASQHFPLCAQYIDFALPL
jgi:hypothetical protein